MRAKELLIGNVMKLSTNAEVIEICRICSSDHQKVLLSGHMNDLDAAFYLIQCQRCSFISLYPILTPAVLKSQYNQSYWHQKKSTTKTLDKLFQLRMLSIIRELQKHVPRHGRILDWGAGDGALLRLLEHSGFDCFGIDIYGTKPNSERIGTTTIEKATFQNGFFDAIACIHVLEHLLDPVGSIKEALRILKPGGIMIVEVPNIASWGFRIFKQRWQPLQIPTHLNHFSPRTLKKIFKDNPEIEIIKISNFSHRASPAAIILSLFPNLEPKLIRGRYGGGYPLLHKIVYLLLQLGAYFPAYLEAAFSRGDIMRIYVKKLKTKLCCL